MILLTQHSLTQRENQMRFIYDSRLCNTELTRQKIFTVETRQVLLKNFSLLFRNNENKYQGVVLFQLLVAVVITLIPWLFLQYRDGIWAVTSCFFVF